MKLQTTLLGKTYVFRDLKQVLAKANEEKTGDKLARLAAETAQERVAAKVVLAGVTLEELRENPAVPYEEDEVTRLIQDDLNEPQYKRIKGWTVSDLREWILDEDTTGADIRRLSRGLTSEMVAEAFWEALQTVCPFSSGRPSSRLHLFQNPRKASVSLTWKTGSSL